MASSATPARRLEYIHLPELDDPGIRLADFLFNTYEGSNVKGYIESTLNLLYSIEDPLVREYLVDKFTGRPVTQEMEKRSQDHFWEHSFITREVRPNKGTHLLTETIYDNAIDPTEHPLDYYILKMPSSQATKNRLVAVENELERAIKHAVDERNNGTVEIVDWGSGPGRYLINVAQRLRDTPYGEAMRATLVDIDSAALKKGEEHANRAGVLEKFTFEQRDLKNIVRQKGNGKYKIGSASGIFCPMSIRRSKILTRGLRPHLSSQDGCLIASSSAYEMLRDDPFLDFLRKEEGGWPLIYKGESDMEEIYRYAGFKGDLFFFRDEPWGHHVMCRGYVSEQKQPPVK